MLEDGWLSPAKSTTVQADLALDTVAINRLGDFRTAALSRTINTETINDLVVRTYLYRASERRSTLVFCVDLDHVAKLTQAFRDAGIDARSVSSLSQPQLRKDTIAGFGKGEFPVLVNCEVLTEGTDIPEIDCIILARPTKSRNLLAQMVGRGLRLSPATSKGDCHIIDIVDSMSEGLIVSPTLLGLTHDSLVNDEREEREKKDVDPDAAMQSPVNDAATLKNAQYTVTYIDQDDPFRLGTSSRKSMAQLSQNSWVVCGDKRYILDICSQSWIHRGDSLQNRSEHLDDCPQVGYAAVVRAKFHPASKSGHRFCRGPRAGDSWR